jgi:hypothetical protein
MSGVSPVGIAANGTRSGNESCDLVFMRLVFSNLLPCLPLLATDFPPVATRMEALTPQPSASQVCTLLRSPCLSRLNFRTFRLQTPSCHFATLGFLRYGFVHRRRRRTTPAAEAATRSWATSWVLVRSEVRVLLGRSPTGSAEASSLHYGLLVRFLMLSTLSVESAVSVHYGKVTSFPIGTFTRQFNRLRRRNSPG